MAGRRGKEFHLCTRLDSRDSGLGLGDGKQSRGDFPSMLCMHRDWGGGEEGQTEKRNGPQQVCFQYCKLLHSQARTQLPLERPTPPPAMEKKKVKWGRSTALISNSKVLFVIRSSSNGMTYSPPPMRASSPTPCQLYTTDPQKNTLHLRLPQQSDISILNH